MADYEQVSEQNIKALCRRMDYDSLLEFTQRSRRNYQICRDILQEKSRERVTPEQRRALIEDDLDFYRRTGYIPNTYDEYPEAYENANAMPRRVVRRHAFMAANGSPASPKKGGCGCGK